MRYNTPKKMIQKTLTFLFLAATFSSFAQYDGDRYRESIFSSVNAQNNVTYGSAPVWTVPYNNTTLKLNVYQPTGDTHNKRPLIIFAHAGGFLNGNKDVDDMVALCDSFARKGYVTATLDYRKGFNPLSNGSAERAVYRGIQDGKAAVRFFKEKAAVYGIDTNNIFFGGMSAGAFMALHVAYMDKETERPQSTYGGGTVNNLGCLDCTGNAYSHSSSIKGVLNYWGATSDTSMIEAGDIPMLIMHGANDPTVPFDYGHPFGLPTLPSTYGGLQIHNRAVNLGLDVEFIVSNGPLHMLDGSDNGTFPASGPNSFWSDTLLPVTEQFLLRLVKPLTTKISDDTLYFCGNGTAQFVVSNTLNSHYEWMYDANQVQTISNNNSSILKLHYAAPGTYTVNVLEFNDILCASDTLKFVVVVKTAPNASFAANTVNMSDVNFTNTSTNATSYAWDFGDGTQSSDENPTHTYSGNGVYTVQLVATSANGCQNTATQTVTIDQLGLDINTANASIQVYPNPVSDMLFIRNDDMESLQIQVLDINGRVIYQSDEPTDSSIIEISTQNWNKGMYFVTVSTDNGQQANMKLIRE